MTKYYFLNVIISPPSPTDVDSTLDLNQRLKACETQGMYTSEPKSEHGGELLVHLIVVQKKKKSLESTDKNCHKTGEPPFLKIKNLQKN